MSPEEPLWERLLLQWGAVAVASLGSTHVSAAGSEAATEEEIGKLSRVKQTLVAPPFFPLHDQVAKGGLKVIEVEMVIEEKKLKVDPAGTEIWALTFNGSVPGPMIVCHENDYIELTLVNPATKQMLHNIDFHASTGALGGAALTEVMLANRLCCASKPPRREPLSITVRRVDR